MKRSLRRKTTLAFVWSQFAPYHADRCAAVAAALGESYRIVGIEIARRSSVYPWPPASRCVAYEHVTLFPDHTLEEIPRPARLRALLRALRRTRTDIAFLCNYERPETLALACLLRLGGKHPHVMFDSKFDDKPRDFSRERWKRRFLAPYRGALASGARTRSYLTFLGVPAERIALGYDTVSIARVHAEAGAPPAPGGAPYEARHFTVVARFVAKKNLTAAIRAYARYRELARANGKTPRPLVLCGDGPERGALEEEVACRDLADVRFLGFLHAPEVARTLAASLALLLPSVEEQWGLVANEALAMGVPVLASTRAGAVDGLVRAGVNGFLFAPDETEGMAAVMAQIAAEEAMWRRLAVNAAATAENGDVARFVDGVRWLLEGR